MQVISSPTGLFLHSTVINSLIFSYVWIITPIFPKHHLIFVVNIGRYRCRSITTVVFTILLIVFKQYAVFTIWWYFNVVLCISDAGLEPPLATLQHTLLLYIFFITKRHILNAAMCNGNLESQKKRRAFICSPPLS